MELGGWEEAGVGLGKKQLVSIVRAGEPNVGSLSGQLWGGWSSWLVRVGTAEVLLLVSRVGASGIHGYS